MTITSNSINKVRKMKETFIPARKMDQPRRGVEEIDFSQDEN